MPEMEDSGMTVISNTVFANQPVVDEDEEATVMRDHGASEVLSEEELIKTADSDMDFDLTGPDTGDELSDLYEPDPDEEDTIIRELPADNQSADEPEFILDEDDIDSEDETIMLDDGDTDVPDEDDDDATLRKEDI
jgi:hypothetical protein